MTVVSGNARLGKQVLDLLAVGDIAANRSLEVILPVPADGAGDVAAIVGGDVDVHLHEADVGIFEVLDGPFGVDQYLGTSVIVGHGLPPSSTNQYKIKILNNVKFYEGKNGKR
jgi:hypothetical protein